MTKITFPKITFPKITFPKITFPKITFGDCSRPQQYAVCLYKKEKDIISESLRDNLGKIESYIRKEQSKRKQDPPFIKYLKDMHMSIQELKDKVDVTVIYGY